jgi:predicted GTPase
MDEVIIYRFQLEVIADALRVVANTYDCRNQKTCLDRMVSQAEQFAINALKGGKNIKVQYGNTVTNTGE